MPEEPEKILSEYIVSTATPVTNTPTGSVNSVPQNIQNLPPATMEHAQPIPVQPQPPVSQPSPATTPPPEIVPPTMHAPEPPPQSQTVVQAVSQVPQNVHLSTPVPSTSTQSQDNSFVVPPLPPRASLTPIAPARKLISSNQASQKSPARLIKSSILVVLAFATISAGTVIAMYHFAPASVFHYAPKSVMNKLYAIWPFLDRFGVNNPPQASSTAQQSDDPDVTTKLNLHTIENAFLQFSNALTNQQKKSYITSTSQRLDPRSGLLQDMIAAGKLVKGVEGAEFPTYYYSYDYDGTVFRVTGLTVKSFSTAELNCHEPKSIRGRWTYCVEQK